MPTVVVNDSTVVVKTDTNISSKVIKEVHQGPVGPRGPAGESTNGSYVHSQLSPEAVWIINHSLNMFPNVTVIDSAGTNVIGHIRYVDSMQIELTFSAAFSGKAYLS